MSAALRIELFVDDPDAFVAFYTGVLSFEVTDDQRQGKRGGYVAVTRDGIRIGAARAWTDVDRAARHVPTGVEIVIEVDDVRAEYTRVINSGWRISDALQQRSWGLQDFRVHDPDGYYLRITGHPLRDGA